MPYGSPTSNREPGSRHELWIRIRDPPSFLQFEQPREKMHVGLPCRTHTADDLEDASVNQQVCC